MRDGVWYIGSRDASGHARVEKHVDDRPPTELSMRLDLACLPSPSFEWGGFDEGSGQLALALCADVLGDDHAEAVCHKFKMAVVACFPLAGFPDHGGGDRGVGEGVGGDASGATNAARGRHALRRVEHAECGRRIRSAGR